MRLGDDFLDPEPSSSDRRSVFARIPVGSITSFKVRICMMNLEAEKLRCYQLGLHLTSGGCPEWPCLLDHAGVVLILLIGIYIYICCFHENQLGFGCNT